MSSSKYEKSTASRSSRADESEAEFIQEMSKRRYDNTVSEIEVILEDENVRIERRSFKQMYSDEELIGTGGFGNVYKARRRADGKIVGVKEIDFARRQKEPEQWVTELERAKIEIQIQLKVQCDEERDPDCAIVPIYDFFTVPSRQRLFIEMKLIRGVNARELQDQYEFDAWEWDRELLQHFIRITKTLDRLHDQGILHRDIKPHNLLYDEKEHRMYLTDFGLSCILPSCSGHVGTEHYRDPRELIRVIPTPDRYSDSYALGLTFATLLLRQHPLRTVRNTPKDRKLLVRLTQKVWQSFLIEKLVEKVEMYEEQDENEPEQVATFRRFVKILIAMTTPIPDPDKLRPTLKSVIAHLESDGEEPLTCGEGAVLCQT